MSTAAVNKPPATQSGTQNTPLAGDAKPKKKPRNLIEEFFDSIFNKGGNDETDALIPDAPDLDKDSTGISGPGTRAGVDETVTDLGQGVVDAETDRAREELKAEVEDQDRAQGVADTVADDKDETVGKVDDALDDLSDSEDRFRANMEGAADDLKKIPGLVEDKFDQISDDFGAVADASFDRLDSNREDALAEVDRGRSAAMQAAVQGIQGNVNNQIATINSNPNLTQAQKASMTAQVRLAGASSMAPAIGSTILGFNQLAVEVHTKFGAISGQIQGQILQGEAAIGIAGGQAFATAQVAVGQMTNQLLEIDANAAVGFANAQSQLLATRSHATMTSNDLLLRLLPEQSTPYIDLTGSATVAYEIGKDLMLSQWEMDAQASAMELTRMAMASMKGDPISNMFMGAASGFMVGGVPGAIFGALGGLFGS